MNPSEIIQAIYNERQRQISKWGKVERRVENPLSCPFWKSTVLGEEYGEVCKAILESKPEELKTELIHVAAVCIAWLESLN